MAWTGEGLTGDLEAAIRYFNKKLPGWWFSVGACHISADATVAPDSAGVDGQLLRLKSFDNGFSVDLPPPLTMAQALICATDLAFSARCVQYTKLADEPIAEIPEGFSAPLDERTTIELMSE